MSKAGRRRGVSATALEDDDAVDRIRRQWAAQRPELDVSALEVLGRMHRCFIQYQVSLNALFAEYGVNMASFDVLAALRRSGEPYRMTAGELARSSLVTTGGITLRIDRLQEAGLVERQRVEDDRRVVFAQLTAAGLELIDQIADAHFENERRLLASLAPEEQATLASLLKALELSIVSARENGSLDPAIK
jgi:DNA-binding MarR family transcriptional regulator